MYRFDFVDSSSLPSSAAFDELYKIKTMQRQPCKIEQFTIDNITTYILLNLSSWLTILINYVHNERASNQHYIHIVSIYKLILCPFFTNKTNNNICKNTQQLLTCQSFLPVPFYYLTCIFVIAWLPDICHELLSSWPSLSPLQYTWYSLSQFHGRILHVSILD